MKRLVMTALLTLVATTPYAVCTEAPKEHVEMSHKKAINLTMEYSGLDEQVPQIVQRIRTSMYQLEKKLPIEIRGKFHNIILLAYDEDDIYTKIKNEVERNVSLDEAIEILKWYKSVIGMEITDIEKDETGDAEAMQKMILEQKKELFADKNRLELMEKIDKQYHGTEFSLDVQIASMRSALKVKAPGASKVEIEAYLKSLRKQSESPIHEWILLTMLYNYKDLEESDLRAYIDFLEKTTTQSFLKSTNKGMLDAITASTDKMISGMVKLKQSQ